MTVDTRTRMIQATARLLWLQGFNGTGVQEILANSAAPKGSLYFHFPGGKEQLAAEAMRASGDTVLGLVRSTMDEHRTTAAGIRAVVEMFADVLRSSEFGLGCPVATVTLERARESETIRAAAQSVYDEWLRTISDALLEDGFPRRRAESLAIVALSLIQGALILSRARMDVAPLHAVAAEVATLLRRPR